MNLAEQRATLEPLPENLQTAQLATWWGQKPGGNWYWRCEVPARHLPGDVLQLRYKDLQQTPNGIGMPRQRGRAAIWQFPGNAARGILMASQQCAGFKVLVEVDDNYLISPPPMPRPRVKTGKLWAEAVGEEFVEEQQTPWKFKIKDGTTEDHSLEAHRRLCGFADGIIVTTEELAKAYRKVNPNVYVCRNSVDPDDWPEPVKPDDGVFRIGYAASHSHWWDANDVQRALGWAAEQPSVEVVMLGLKPAWSFPYRHLEWTTDLAEYRASLGILDLGLCPLREGPWADGKSDIKLLEYSLSGAASVVARRPPYDEWTDTDMALTAETPKEFLKHVRWAVRNQDGVREMAARAKARILAERTIQSEIGRWRDAVTP